MHLSSDLIYLTLIQWLFRWLGWFFWAGLLLWSGRTWGQVDQTSVVRFRTLKNTDGLSQNSVYDIVQDRFGFIWMATEDGLNRYDGTRFRVYKHNPKDNQSLSSSFVRCLLVDNDGQLWIGTNEGGLNRYNYQSDNFTHYKHQTDQPNSLINNQVWALTTDKDNKLWIGTSEGLSLMDTQNEQFTHYTHDPKHYSSLASNWVRSLLADSEGRVWVGCDPGGLHLFLSPDQQFLHFPGSPRQTDGMPSNRIVDMIEDGETLWIATYEGGLVQFDKTTRKVLRKYGAAQHPALRDIQSLLLRQGKLWLLTRERGLLILDLATDQLQHYTHQNNNPSAIGSDLLLSIFEDRSETVWIGTAENGLSKYNAFSTKFLHINAQNSHPDLGNTVFDFAQDLKGHLWVATDAGLFRSTAPESVSRGWERWRSPDADIQLLLNKVQVITRDQNGMLWMGTRQRLIRLNPETNDFQTTKISGGGRQLSITAILPDTQNKLWVGTSGGLYRFSFQDNELDIFTANEGLQNDQITTLYQDREQRVWVGTQNGLGCYLADQNQFTFYKNIPDDANSLSNSRIFSMTEDTQGRLWIGTANGLNQWDPERETFSSFVEGPNELPNGFIKGILGDADNNLWISTNNGISRMDASNETFVNFSTFDGLQGLEFLPHACLMTQEGAMLFGGNNGFNWFRPDLLIYNTHPPRTVITDVRLLGQSLAFDALQNQQLTLEHDQNTLAFSFAVLDFVLPEKNRVLFKLEGLDKNWRYDESGRNVVEYNNLAPGKYTFRLRGYNNDGTRGPETSLQITITPPIWKEIWFQGILLTLGLAVIYALYRYRLWQVERQSRLLEQQVQQRTTEIRQKNEQLESQKQALEEQKQSLQEQHQQIEQQHKALRASTEKLQDAYRDIEQKNNSITDSIRYAKTIQEAVLPTRARIRQTFTDGFVLYLPKAIVSGDFFWFVQIKEMSFVAAVDCTGHGVPGAFMSLIGNTLLNEIVNQDQVYEPHQILTKLHERIRVALKQAEKANEDGMDMVLCRIRSAEAHIEVTFAGAKRPLYIYEQKSKDLKEMRGDRRSIGGRQKGTRQQFTKHLFLLQPGDVLYLTTDGFADQINAQRQKYGSNHLKTLLQQIAPLDLASQELKLRHTLQSHRQEVPQIDDVTILGLRL
ncbi:MAG: two-component regulator propeller domain-containing protein [Bernardetiaceae bacterium]